MLSTLARAAIVSTVEKGTGVPPAGPLSTVLLTTGAALATMRGRRAVGFALLAVGGVLRWQETVRPERQDRTAPPAGSRRAAFAATAPR
jgi:uncharacterized membrane protein (UPF0136 family)